MLEAGQEPSLIASYKPPGADLQVLGKLCLHCQDTEETDRTQELRLTGVLLQGRRRACTTVSLATTVSQPTENLLHIAETMSGGRCLGGSTSINGLAYGRGSSSIYDLWQLLGNPGWSWNDVVSFFKKVSDVDKIPRI